MTSRLALRRTSLIDFPGCVAAVAFLPGCSLACPYCHNAEVARDSGAVDWIALGEFLGFLDSRRGKLDGIVLSGGEPCMREDLPRLVEAIRKRGMRVKIDTNGMHPETLAASIVAGADFVAIDLKTDPGSYGTLGPKVDRIAERLAASVEASRAPGVEREFRVTCAPGIVDARAIRALSAIPRSDEVLILQRFVPGPTLDPAWSALPMTTDAEMEALLGIAKERLPLARIRGSRTENDERRS